MQFNNTCKDSNTSRHRLEGWEGIVQKSKSWADVVMLVMFFVIILCHTKYLIKYENDDVKYIHIMLMYMVTLMLMLLPLYTETNIMSLILI